MNNDKDKQESNKTTIYYVREGYIGSIIADLTSIGVFLVGLWFNYKVLNGDWYVSIFFLLIIFIIVLSRANSKIKRFNTEEELVKYLTSPKESND